MARVVAPGIVVLDVGLPRVYTNRDFGFSEAEVRFVLGPPSDESMTPFWALRVHGRDAKITAWPGTVRLYVEYLRTIDELRLFFNRTLYAAGPAAVAFFIATGRRAQRSSDG